jgi:hypothetical protein
LFKIHSCSMFWIRFISSIPWSMVNCFFN